MTPPNGTTNRAIAGIATALGIAIGVAPTALLAQDVAPVKEAAAAKTNKVPTTQAGVLDKSSTPLYTNKGTAGSQHKTEAIQNKGVGTTQYKTAGVQEKGKPLVPANQIKSQVPAVQSKPVTATTNKNAIDASQM